MKKTISILLVLSTMISLISINVLPASAASSQKIEQLFEFSWTDESYSNKHTTHKTIIVSLEEEPIKVTNWLILYRYRIIFTHELLCVPYDWLENEVKINDKKDHYTGYHWSINKPLSIEEIFSKDSYIQKFDIVDKLKVIYQCEKALGIVSEEPESMLQLLKSEVIESAKNDIEYSFLVTIKSTILNFFGLNATDEVIDRVNTAGSSINGTKDSPSFVTDFFNNLGIKIDTWTIAMEKALEQIDNIEGNAELQYKNLMTYTANDLYDIIVSIPE